MCCNTAVFDPATLVRAFLSPGGLSDTLLQQAIGGVFLLSFSLFFSEETLAETERTLLASERIRRRYPYSDAQVPAFGQLLRGGFPPITDLPKLTGVSRDLKDDMVIACALKARAQYIVTRDDDLLSRGTYRRIKMITPEAFSAFLRQRARRRPRS